MILKLFGRYISLIIRLNLKVNFLGLLQLGMNHVVAAFCISPRCAAEVTLKGYTEQSNRPLDLQASFRRRLSVNGYASRLQVPLLFSLSLCGAVIKRFLLFIYISHHNMPIMTTHALVFVCHLELSFVAIIYRLVVSTKSLSFLLFLEENNFFHLIFFFFKFKVIRKSNVFLSSFK